MQHESLNNLLLYIQQALPDHITDAYIRLRELTLVVKADTIVQTLLCLRDHKNFQFKQLVDVCGVDYPNRALRFEIVYHLLSLRKNIRIRIKIFNDAQQAVPSVSHIFSAANWYEREIWDLYGISFTGHPDLRRILTDYDFEGHPLRKDFPLTGYVEVRYDDVQQKVVYHPVQLPQDYRDFDFLSPWEGLTPKSPILPGDEKANLTQSAAHD